MIWLLFLYSFCCVFGKLRRLILRPGGCLVQNADFAGTELQEIVTRPLSSNRGASRLDRHEKIKRPQKEKAVATD